ncbi:MAG: hypothetical protein LBN29_11395 [Mediterranea sp.]|jgi:hypothetical protein|nr:hypothetical protein [Mediterranea sp.]
MDKDKEKDKLELRIWQLKAALLTLEKLRDMMPPEIYEAKQNYLLDELSEAIREKNELE